MAKPLRLDFTDRATNELEQIVQWLLTLSEEVAVRFVLLMDTELPVLCQRAADGLSSGSLPALLDEVGSVSFAWPVYRLTLSTQKRRRRRSASGTYYVYYEMLSTTQDGSKPDTLRVLSILHAASAPPTAWLDDTDERKDQ